MADNYLERQYEAYEQRKAALGKPGKKRPRPSDRKRFYTRPVVTKSHEEQQAEIAARKDEEGRHD